MALPDPDADRAAIIAVIEGESAAYMSKDFDRWAKYWLQTPAARHWDWSPDLGLTLLSGWSEISDLTASSMAAFPEPLTDNARRDWLDFRITPDMAWVVLDQYTTDRGDPHESSGMKHEMWLLLRCEGHWRVACICTLQPVVEAAKCPVVRVDGDGRVQWINPQARQRLKDHDGLMISAGRLRARAKSVDRSLQAAIAWASRGLVGPLKRAALAQTAATGGALPVLATDHREGAAILCWVQPTDGTILVTFDDTEQANRRIDAAAVLFRLSAAQARLVRLLISGLDLAAAANALSVSVNTARTQLRRVFEKTGVHNQSALVRLMLSIAPPLQ